MRRLAIVWASHAGIFAISGTAAFLLRFDFQVPAAYLTHLAFALTVWVLVKSAFFHFVRLDRSWWRYVGIHDLLGIGWANMAGSGLSFFAIRWTQPGIPLSVYVLDLILCFLCSAGVRVIARAASQAASSARSDSSGRNTLIYGAGDAGVILLRELQSNLTLPYRVRGFVDDRADKRGRRILGSPVLGDGQETTRLVQEHGIETILIAVPSATGSQMAAILERCRAAGVECKTVPGLADIIRGIGLARQIREVAVEDLLGRKPVHLDVDRIGGAFRGKRLMVTGAAGSIGSELCRQIAMFAPSDIVGMDIAESVLFEFDREMRERFPRVAFHAEIGSVQNRARLDEMMDRHRPAAIYHAAAYKHVPLMEAHVVEAVENNILGTWNVAAAAAAHGVRDFVLISTDKAVRPASIMGVTKRIAEMALRAMPDRGTKYVAVRFGNVLGSNGSVIPIFKEIAAGGPVRVTHPEMRRFFMTIPEACQLVLQAGVMARRGQTCVLDMGEPVRIADLARTLILLSGLTPDEDIRIEYTGIRPGEKLAEELSTIYENTAPTSNERIHVYVEEGASRFDVLRRMDDLRRLCRERDEAGLIAAMTDLVPEYVPSPHVSNRVNQTNVRHAVS